MSAAEFLLQKWVAADPADAVVFSVAVVATPLMVISVVVAVVVAVAAATVAAVLVMAVTSFICWFHPLQPRAVSGECDRSWSLYPCEFLFLATATPCMS